MITDGIRNLVHTIKTERLNELKLKQEKENEEQDKLNIRYELARCGLVCLKQKLDIVYEDSNKLSNLGITITHRYNNSDPDGIYQWNGNIYGTHHHYIDIRHSNSVGTIRVYASCEPSLRVFYGTEIYGRSRGNNYLNGFLHQFCESKEGEKLSLITNPHDIVECHANVIGRLLAEAEM